MNNNGIFKILKKDAHLSIYKIRYIDKDKSINNIINLSLVLYMSNNTRSIIDGIITSILLFLFFVHSNFLGN